MAKPLKYTVHDHARDGNVFHWILDSVAVLREKNQVGPFSALMQPKRSGGLIDVAAQVADRRFDDLHEFEAFVSLTYNIGEGAFCGSTAARKLRAGDYAGACAEILRWNKFQGRVLHGLTKRREVEYRTCMGETA